VWGGRLKLTEIVRVDSKGRITIPMVIREALNIIEGMYVILIADTDKREIIVSPAISPGMDVYEIYMEIRDIPGALAEVTDFIAKQGIDLITTHCTSVRRGETAECVLVADLTNAKVKPEELKAELLKLMNVKLVNIKSLRRGY